VLAHLTLLHHTPHITQAIPTLQNKHYKPWRRVNQYHIASRYNHIYRCRGLNWQHKRVLLLSQGLFRHQSLTELK
jgi:hypothetical protein